MNTCVMFEIDNIDVSEGPVRIGGVIFRKLTPSLAIEWGYERMNFVMQGMIDEVMGRTVGVASVRAGTSEIAAERAQHEVGRALNILRIQISSGRPSRVWERQHRQEIGTVSGYEKN